MQLIFIHSLIYYVHSLCYFFQFVCDVSFWGFKLPRPRLCSPAFFTVFIIWVLPCTQIVTQLLPLSTLRGDISICFNEIQSKCNLMGRKLRQLSCVSADCSKTQEDLELWPSLREGSVKNNDSLSTLLPQCRYNALACIEHSAVLRTSRLTFF